MRLEPLPGELRWAVEPAAWEASDGGVTLTAAARTDLFSDPGGAARVATAPRLLGPADGDFVFGALVRVDFAATFDAGALVLWSDGERWAKLCFEYSPQAEPTVVSVVTQGVSDDANAFTVDGECVWLRIARTGSSVAFHASVDGRYWRLVRHFALEASELGFVAQSPTGEGCRVSFEHVFFRRERLADLRSGA